MKMIRYLILIAFFFALISCNQTTEKTEEEFQFFPSEYAGYKGERLILEISSEFTECGEWGGHKEKMYVSIKKDKQFYMKYELFCADCDSLIEFVDEMGTYATPYNYIVDSAEFKLNKEHKEAIYQYAQNLLSAKFRESSPGGGCNSFEIIKHGDYQGPGMKIRVFTYDSQILFDYVNLLKKLDLFQKDRFSCVKYTAIEEYGIKE